MVGRLPRLPAPSSRDSVRRWRRGLAVVAPAPLALVIFTFGPAGCSTADETNARDAADASAPAEGGAPTNPTTDASVGDGQATSDAAVNDAGAPGDATAADADAAPDAGPTYYVRSTGSDTHGCTSPTTDACSTIARGLEVATPGSTVDVGAATYGKLTVSRSGTSSAQLTIRASGDAALSSLDVTGSYVTVDGFVITGGGVDIEGGSSGVVVSNNVIHNTAGSAAVFVDGCSATAANAAIVQNEIYDDPGFAGHDGIDLWCNTRNITAEGNYIHDLQPNGDGDHVDVIQAYGSSGTSNSGNVVRNNYAVNVQEGVLFKDFPTSNLVLRDNVLDTQGPWDIYVFQATTVTIDHNTAPDGINFDGSTGGVTALTLTNNVSGQIALLNGGVSFADEGYNLASSWVGTSAGGHDLTAAPTYTGGKAPATWGGFMLAAATPGYHAGSDGLSMGSEYFGAPGAGRPNPP